MASNPEELHMSGGVGSISLYSCPLPNTTSAEPNHRQKENHNVENLN